MNKAALVIVAISVLLMGAVIWNLSRKPTLDTSGVTLFFSTTCTHCKEVEAYISEKKIDEKVQIARKEISIPENTASLNQAVEYCKIDTTQGIGVPFLFAEGKCYIGSPDVKGYFDQKLGLSETTPSGSPSAQPSSSATDSATTTIKK